MKNSDLKFSADIAVCFEPVQNQLVAASYDASGELYIERFAVRETLHAEILSWRTRLGLKNHAESVFRFVPNLFMEQTRIALVPDEALLLNDSELTEWLAEAATKRTFGQDGKPVFETSLADSAYDFTRLPNGLVSLTEIPREALDLTRRTLIQVATPLTAEDLEDTAHLQNGGALPEFPQAVETRLRAVTRYLSESEREYFASLSGDETIAVFAFTSEGVGFALWNPNYSFYSELGEFFHLDTSDQNVPDEMDKGEYLGQLYAESVYNFLNDQFYRRVVPDDESVAPTVLKRLYWTAAENLVNPLEFLISEFSDQTEFSFVHSPTAMEEMVVSGLLLGCDDETTELVPAVNLANDIAMQHQAILDTADQVINQELRAGRRLALIYMMLPVACAIGLIVGLMLNNARISIGLGKRESTASAEKARLQPLLNARAEYEKTLAWYEDVLRQIVGLRKKQTAALGFAARLDPLFPNTNAFYVSDLKLLPGGNFELKGLARDQFAVSEFVRQMEFAVGDDEKRYFSNLAVEFKQGSQSDKPSSVASGVTGTLAPGVSGFLVKGNFAPASAIKAQPANAAAPASAAVPVPAAPTNGAMVPNGGAVNAVPNNPAAPVATAPAIPNNAGGAK